MNVEGMTTTRVGHSRNIKNQYNLITILKFLDDNQQYYLLKVPGFNIHTIDIIIYSIPSTH